MSALAARPGGQNHDRLTGGNVSFSTVRMASPENDGPDDVVEITAGQKMLSAMSGSLFTSLLVTPLDVVRVRWQSQNMQQPVAPVASTINDFRKLTIANPATFRPQDLGVTSCCREVFFMNNNAEYCIAVPRGTTASSLGAPGGALSAASSSAATASAADCAVEETQRRTINSTVDGFRKIARNEGFFTLWRGLSPTLLMAIPANIIYFTGYDWLRYNPRSPIAANLSDHYAPLAAGAFARVVAGTAVSPIELFRTRMQATPGIPGTTTTGHLANAIRDVRSMVDAHGYRSLWRGLTLTLWRDVPFSGIYWWGYETIRGRLTDARGQRRGRSAERGVDGGGTTADPSERSRRRTRSQSRENHAATFVDSFTAGALSGAFASVVTMPFDVGKTRTQVYRDAAGSGAGRGGGAAAALAPEEQSMTRLLWHIFRTEGAAGLFRGWIPRTLKVAPACAIMISSYEVGKRAFRGVNERSAELRAGRGDGELK